MSVSIDQQFIEYIVKSLVGHPEEVKIERRIDEKGVLLELIVNPEDLGRVIGKRGATAQSIRTLLRALGTKNDARYNLKIVDTGPPRDRGQMPDDGEQRTDDSSVSTEQTEEQKVDEGTVTDTASDTQAADPVVVDDDILMDDEDDIQKPQDDNSDIISRTRRELADLDDLDL